MNRTLLIVVIGLAFGFLAHDLWLEVRAPDPASELETQLLWMKHSLQLDDQQFARIKALHEELSPRLVLLAAQVTQMKDRSAAFERERQSQDQVDFLQYARFVEERRKVDRECSESTRTLVTAASGVMTPEQRSRYLDILAPALKDTGALPPESSRPVY